MKKKIKALLSLLDLSPYRTDLFLFGFQRCFDESHLVSNFLLKKLDSGVVIDVGVAWGTVSAPFLDKGWTVFGFEPDLDSKKRAAIANLLENYSHFYCSYNAVSDKGGKTLSFYVSAESAGISSLHNFKNHKLSHTVTTIRLSDFLREKNINQVDFLKIDTEGHDLFVLKGFPFDKVQPAIVIVEFDDFKTKPLGYSYKDIGDLLRQNGYFVYLSEWFPIKKYGTKHKFRCLRKYPAELVDSRDWGNFIAVTPCFFENFEKYLLEHSIRKYYVE